MFTDFRGLQDVLFFGSSVTENFSLKRLNVVRSPPRATTNNFRESTEIIPGAGYRTVNIKKRNLKKNSRETKYRTKLMNYIEMLSTNQINVVKIV